VNGGAQAGDPSRVGRAGAPRSRGAEMCFGERLTRRQHWLRSALTSGPGIAWVVVFLVAPLVAIAVISFWTRGAYGEVEHLWTFGNYRRFMGFGLFGYDPLYPRIIARSLGLGAATAALSVLAGLPLAFFIAGLPERFRPVALTLVIIPFWTNLLVRTYAWQILLQAGGFLARAAAAAGLVDAGAPLYPSAGAVLVGMLCDYLPFLVLPLYASVEKIDWTLAEAAADLHADGLRAFRHAILPQILPGLVAGVILVFVPATGQFVIPDLLGGAKTVMLGNAIAQQFGPSRDWPFGSAIACLGMALVMLGLWAYARAAGRRGQEVL